MSPLRRPLIKIHTVLQIKVIKQAFITADPQQDKSVICVLTTAVQTLKQFWETKKV